MMWNYVKFPDETQIAYSDLHDDGTVEVRVERPVDYGFDLASCSMPAYQWSNVEGFSNSEIAEFESFLRDNAPLIFELAESPHGDRMTA